MNTAATVNKITAQTVAYVPAVMAAMQAVEATATPDMSGATKQQIVVSQVVGGIEAGSAALENSPNPTVAGIAQLVNLFASIFHATGLFQRKHVAA